MKNISSKDAIIGFLVFLIIIGMILTSQLFLAYRAILNRDVDSIISDHLENIRGILSKDSGTQISQPLLQAVMNKGVHPTDEAEAHESMKNMLDLVAESKRRSFKLPLVNKEVLGSVRKWSSQARNVDAKNSAVKLLTHLAERHVEIMDQIVSQSFVEISKTDSSSAVTAMKTLEHYVDGVLLAGIKIDPKMVLLSPNESIVKSWLSGDNAEAKLAAESLLKSIEELTTI